MNTREIAVEYRLTHWAQIMRNRIDSGLSVRAFCENAGVHENIYYYWQRKLREATCEGLARAEREGNGPTLPTFAEIKLSGQSANRSMATADQSQVRIETDGVQITASNGYPVDKLAYLLRVVAQSC
jgi:transposase-like protein